MPGIRLATFARRAYLGVSRVVSPYAAVVVDSVVYVVSTDDDGPGGRLFVSRRRPEFDVLARALGVLREHGEPTSGTMLVDVGANIGTTAIPALAVHGFGRALAFEPDPRNVRVLRANGALNGLDGRLDVIAAAAGAEAGRAAFRPGRPTERGWRAGTGGLVRAGTVDSDSIEVAVVTVDEELASRSVEPEDVGLLWLDVQGHEAEVAAGASRLVEASRPLVFASRRRKLKKTRSLDALVQLVATHYNRVVDLRPPTAGSSWRPELRPAAEVEELVRSRATTDILALARRRQGAGE